MFSPPALFFLRVHSQEHQEKRLCLLLSSLRSSREKTRGGRETIEFG